MGPTGLSPSFSMPTLRHFMKRQAWQDLRLRFVISHSLVAGQLYSMFPASRHKRGGWQVQAIQGPDTDRDSLAGPTIVSYPYWPSQAAFFKAGALSVSESPRQLFKCTRLVGQGGR